MVSAAFSASAGGAWPTGGHGALVQQSPQLWAIAQEEGQKEGAGVSQGPYHWLPVLFTTVTCGFI